MLDVLLVSPRLPTTHNKYCGDHAYTDMLLETPPPGVRYHHYEDLIGAGSVRKIESFYRVGPRLATYGLLPPDLWAEYLVSDFVPDILHIYGFSAVVRFPRYHRVPVVIGSSTGSYSDLKYYAGWPERRIRQARWLKRQYLKLVDAHDSSLRPEKAARVHVWSQFSQRMHLEEGFVRPDQIEVIYPAVRVQQSAPTQQQPDHPLTFLFVGSDFVRKNGEMVVNAFRRVHRDYPSVRLILIGRPRDNRLYEEPGIWHRHFLPRPEIESIYQQADVLILPSNAEGFGLVLVEAMGHGLPGIAVDAWAMPEIITHGQNGYLIQPGSEDDLVTCIRRFAAEPGLLSHMREQSRYLLEERFTAERHNDRLRALYGQTLMNSIPTGAKKLQSPADIRGKRAHP